MSIMNFSQNTFVILFTFGANDIFYGLSLIE